MGDATLAVKQVLCPKSVVFVTTTATVLIPFDNNLDNDTFGDFDEQFTMESNNNQELNPVFNPTLVRKLICVGGNKEKPKRVSNEAALAAGELLRLLVQEARERAAIEAECEKEGDSTDIDDGKIVIRADHVAKIAAELLMDFS